MFERILNEANILRPRSKYEYKGALSVAQSDSQGNSGTGLSWVGEK